VLKRLSVATLILLACITVLYAASPRCIFWPRGQTCTTDSGGTVTVSISDVEDRSYNNNDSIMISDGTGYSISGPCLVNGSPSTSTLMADSGLATADLDGDSQFFYATDANFPESGIVGDMTIQAWIKPTNFDAERAIVGKYLTSGNNRSYIFRVNTAGELAVRISSDGIGGTNKATAGVDLVAGAWTHVAFVYDASEGTGDFYKNGAFVEQETGLPNSIADKAGNFFVGSHEDLGNPQQFWLGGTFNVAIYDDIRTAAEIRASAADWDYDHSGEGNIIGAWMFDEAAAAAAIDNTQGDAGRDLIPYDGGDVTFSGLRSTDGGYVQDIEKVGVSIDCAETYSAVAANNTIHAVTTEDICVSTWIMKVSAPTGRDYILSKQLGTGNFTGWAFFVETTTGAIEFLTDSGVPGASYTAGTTNVCDGKWHHVVAVIDRDTVANCKIYVDGVDDTASSGVDVNSVANTAIMNLSVHPSHLEGSLSDLKLYYAAGAVWSAAEILYQATHPHDVSASAGTITDNWLLDEGSGLTLNGKVNNLTLSNVAAWTQEAFVSKNLMLDTENGGIGGWTVGDAATAISKSTTQIKKDTQSLKVLNGDATQAFARQTITTVANADYWFHGWFFAPTTANGASQLVDVDANAALGITVTQAGLSAGWNEIEFSFAADDTSTTIDLGSGSVTNAEFGYWDSVELRENLIVNGGMEGVYDDESGGGAGTINVAPGWNNSGCETDGTDTLDKEATIVHSGSASQKIDVDGSAEGIITESAPSLVVGKSYTLSCYMYVTSGEGRLQVFSSGGANKTVSSTVSAWTKLELTFTATTTSHNIFIRSLVGAATLYIDNISLIQVDEAAASTADKGSGYIPLRNPLYIGD